MRTGFFSIQEVDTLETWLQTGPGSGLSALCPWVPWPATHGATLQFSGRWFVVSMVSDCKVFLGKKDHLLMPTMAVTAAAQGNLSVHQQFPG